MALAVLLASSLALSALGGPSSYGYHPDELRLVRAVGHAGGSWDWSDPALLRHVGRMIASLAPDAAPSDVARAGRGWVALLGTASVALCWRLARDALAPPYALLAAAILAASPLLVIGTHHFAPEVPSLAMSLWAVLCLARLMETERRSWAVLLGVAAGLAASIHYAAALVLVLAAVAPAIAGSRGHGPRARRLGLAAAVAALTFLAVDAELLATPALLLSGPWLQIRRLLGGDHLYVGGLSHGLTFHLVASLRPGVTLPVLAAAAAGAAIVASRWRRLPPGPRLALAYGALAYALAELSPLKPVPGSSAYVLPAVPALAISSAFATRAVAARTRGTRAGWLPAALAVLLIGAPALGSARLLAAAGDDTRERADAWIARHAGRILREPHTSDHPADVASVAAVDLASARASGVTHVVASSFVYETFARGSHLAGQSEYVYQRHERYQELFEYPYVEFAPKGPSFGWSNPVVRVIDIREARPPGRPGRIEPSVVSPAPPPPDSPAPPGR